MDVAKVDEKYWTTLEKEINTMVREPCINEVRNLWNNRVYFLMICYKILIKMHQISTIPPSTIVEILHRHLENERSSHFDKLLYCYFYIAYCYYFIYINKLHEGDPSAPPEAEVVKGTDKDTDKENRVRAVENASKVIVDNSSKSQTPLRRARSFPPSTKPTPNP